MSSGDCSPATLNKSLIAFVDPKVMDFTWYPSVTDSIAIRYSPSGTLRVNVSGAPASLITTGSFNIRPDGGLLQESEIHSMSVRFNSIGAVRALGRAN